jgi:hypothetical protein
MLEEIVKTKIMNTHVCASYKSKRKQLVNSKLVQYGHFHS